MSDGPISIRLGKAASEFNVGVSTIVDFLHKKGFKIDSNPNTKLTPEMHLLLVKEYQPDKVAKDIAKSIEIEFQTQKVGKPEDKKPEVHEVAPVHENKELLIRGQAPEKETTEKPVVKKAEPKPEIAEPVQPQPKPEVAPIDEIVEPAEPVETPADQLVKEAKEAAPSLKGPVVIGSVDISQFEKKPKSKDKKAAGSKAPAAAPVENKEPVREVPVVEAPVETPPVITPPPAEPERRPAEQPMMDGVYNKTDANFIQTKFTKLEGPKILSKIELPAAPKPETRKPVASSTDEDSKSKKRKRKRLNKGGEQSPAAPGTQAKPQENGKTKTHTRDRSRHIDLKPELSEEDIQKQIKETLQRLSGTGKSKASKYRREKRQAVSQHMAEEMARQEEDKKVLKVTEFVTANDLAVMMNIPVTQIIATCMAVGMFVSINQRLDAETIALLADEFGFTVEFVSVEVQEAIDSDEVTTDPAKLTPRNPIVTVMGHVDHGKTSLLDYIRSANVIAGEAGGITQHIGAYEVQLEDGRKISFLDTPGHEAFTAMRARGAQVTDIVIIVVAADDTVMPQTKEAINHAQAAGVPMVFAINKIDKPGANPEKIKEELSKLNILVEDWGGKYQSQEISAKKGTNVGALLDKVLLEAELLDLKADSSTRASGTVIESSLDKGRGYIAKLLVQNGTLRIGDFLLAGSVYGKVKAMYNERNVPLKEAGPSVPVLLLGLTGAPQAGDKFKVMVDEREAKQIATKRQQLQREQGIRTQKHITLDEIGRRIAIGDFKELNIIVKADVDGSVEALSDSLLKLSTPQVQVNVIHKSVGAITESDVLLASASNAVIVGFQVRPSMSARKLAEREEIDIRLYSIIYTAINEIKLAIEGMLAPEIEEKVTCNVEIREVFRITKVGSVAGCMVLDGKITRNTRIRVIRDGIVVHTGSLGSLKRFKDDAKEVLSGYECGLNIDNFNDIRVGDIIEGYEEVEVKRKL